MRKKRAACFTVSTLSVAIYLLVGDKPKACRIRGIHLPISQKHQKAILAWLLTLLSQKHPKAHRDLYIPTLGEGL